jgi:hypothetical protein
LFFGVAGCQAGQPVGCQRVQLRRDWPGGEQLGQSRAGDDTRRRRSDCLRDLAMVPSQGIPCKAPKAKLFMKGRDFLLAFRP